MDGRGQGEDPRFARARDRVRWSPRWARCRSATARGCSSRSRRPASTATVATPSSTSARRPAMTSSPRSSSRGSERRSAPSRSMRVACTRTGVVLSPSGGALAKMLPFFKLGIGGPVAGGRQYVPWVHLDDVVGAMLACVDDDALSGPVNLTAPNPVTNGELSRALGHALGRPSGAAGPRSGGQAALRRDGRDGDDRSARRPGSPARGRVRVPPPRASSRRSETCSAAPDGDRRAAVIKL